MCMFSLTSFWMDFPIYTPPAVYFENSLAYSKNSQSSFLSSLYHTLLPHTTPGNFIHFCSFNKWLYADGSLPLNMRSQPHPCFVTSTSLFLTTRQSSPLGNFPEPQTQHPFLLSPPRKVSWDNERSNTLKPVNRQLNENLFSVGWHKVNRKKNTQTYFHTATLLLSSCDTSLWLKSPICNIEIIPPKLRDETSAGKQLAQCPAHTVVNNHCLG